MFYQKKKKRAPDISSKSMFFSLFSTKESFVNNERGHDVNIYMFQCLTHHLISLKQSLRII